MPLRAIIWLVSVYQPKGPGWPPRSELGNQDLLSQGSLQSCPSGLQGFLEEDRRWWTNQARLQRLALVQVCQLLEAAEIPAVALKGSHLAWHVYAHPSHRPLRDLDILIPETRFQDGARLLLGIGCKTLTDKTTFGNLPDWANYEIKLIHPLGIVIELHRALWYYAVEGGIEDFSLRPDFWLNTNHYTTWVDGIRYFSEPYRYLHLLVHHIYKHHLGVGPLGLQDLRLLTSSPSLSCAEVEHELAAIGAPSLDRIARQLVDVFNGVQSEGVLKEWLPLIFLTPEQNQLIYRARRSIRMRFLMWLKIQWLGGNWSSTRRGKSEFLVSILMIFWKAPAMVLRPGLQRQIQERLAGILHNPQDKSSESLKETLENPVTLRENGPVIAGVDWLHGR